MRKFCYFYFFLFFFSLHSRKGKKKEKIEGRKRKIKTIFLILLIFSLFKRKGKGSRKGKTKKENEEMGKKRAATAAHFAIFHFHFLIPYFSFRKGKRFSISSFVPSTSSPVNGLKRNCRLKREKPE